MSSYNRVILIGRLACDVEQKATPSGVAYARFRLAVDRRARKGADGANNADFIPIVAWDRLAEICGQYLTKGKLVAIEGRLQTRTYEAADGSKRSAFDVVADDMRMLSTRDNGARPNGGGSYDSNFANDSQIGYDDMGGSDVDSENLPF